MLIGLLPKMAGVHKTKLHIIRIKNMQHRSVKQNDTREDYNGKF